MSVLLPAVALLVVTAIHTAIAAVMIRFFRIRLETGVGMALYSLFLVPVVLTASLLVVGQLPIFPALGRNTVLTVTILFPLVLGFVLDFFWLPDPDTVSAEWPR